MRLMSYKRMSSGVASWVLVRVEKTCVRRVEVEKRKAETRERNNCIDYNIIEVAVRKAVR